MLVSYKKINMQVLLEKSLALAKSDMISTFSLNHCNTFLTFKMAATIWKYTDIYECEVMQWVYSYSLTLRVGSGTVTRFMFVTRIA